MPNDSLTGTKPMIFLPGRELAKKIRKHLAIIRKRDPMASLSDALRDLIERGVKR